MYGRVCHVCSIGCLPVVIALVGVDLAFVVVLGGLFLTIFLLEDGRR